MEVAAFVFELELHGAGAEKTNLRWDGSGCPYQAARFCSVHRFRPFGCRVFFCDPLAAEWQQVQYERFHRNLKELHQRLQVPYFYLEWRQALAATGLVRLLPPAISL